MPSGNELREVELERSSQPGFGENHQAKRIKVCSILMIVMVVIGVALSFLGYTPVGGGAFLVAFICALIVVADTLNSRRHA